MEPQNLETHLTEEDLLAINILTEFVGRLFPDALGFMVFSEQSAPDDINSTVIAIHTSNRVVDNDYEQAYYIHKIKNVVNSYANKVITQNGFDPATFPKKEGEGD